MNEHTLSIYDRQLLELIEDIQQMGKRANEMVAIASRSLTEQSENTHEEARAKDKEVNALDQQIEEKATVILALQKPVAIDLRVITSAIKFSRGRWWGKSREQLMRQRYLLPKSGAWLLAVLPSLPWT